MEHQVKDHSTPVWRNYFSSNNKNKRNQHDIELTIHTIYALHTEPVWSGPPPYRNKDVDSSSYKTCSLQLEAWVAANAPNTHEIRLTALLLLAMNHQGSVRALGFKCQDVLEDECSTSIKLDVMCYRIRDCFRWSLTVFRCLCEKDIWFLVRLDDR